MLGNEFGSFECENTKTFDSPCISREIFTTKHPASKLQFSSHRGVNIFS